MVAQLDPGFTSHGFWANVAIQVLAAFVGTIGAFIVAWLLYRRQRNEERTQFEESLAHERDLFQKTLAHDRELFQENIAHDLQVRRDEDLARRRERDQTEQLGRRRLLLTLLSECEGNMQAIEFMRVNPPGRIPLRRDLLDANLGDIADLPTPVAASIQTASLHIDQYNSVPQGDPMYSDALIVAEPMIEDAGIWLALYLKGDVVIDEEASSVLQKHE